MTQLVDAQALVHPAQTRRPADTAAARDALLEARETDASVLVHGGVTKLSWGAPPARERPWLVVDTRHLDGLVHHDPGDLTATVRSGTVLDDVQARLAAAGQELAIDPPRRGGRPTVGGIFAANDAGPRRFGYGGVRDLVIGATVALADGTLARSGGTVIKNVAGYDLAKLWCGSFGTLCLVVELTVRLHPIPEARRAVLVPAPARVAAPFVLDVLASPVECSAIEWASPQRALLVELEGRAAGLAGQLDGLARIARRHGLEMEPADGDGGDEEGLIGAWREAHGGGGAEVTVARAATLPSDLAVVADDVAAATEGCDVEWALFSHAGSGLHDVVLTAGTVTEHAQVVRGWRERVSGRGGSVVLRQRREGVDGLVDPWGPPGSSRQMELMRAVKAAVDPEGRMSPGRFVGGI